MSILNVNQIQPVGSGQTITISASDITASSATITASSVTGNLTGNVTGNLTGNVTGNVTSSGISTFSSGLSITGSSSIGNDELQLTFVAPNGIIKPKNSSGSPAANLDLYSTDTGGNSNRGLRLQYTGYVGIGSDLPANVLDVQGNAHAKIHIGTTGNGYATGIQINHAKGAAGAQSWQIQTDGTTDGNLKIRNATSGNDVMFFREATDNVEISNGNLVFSTSGTGIDFSSASGSAAGSTSALLDDYEEGTWTPVATNVTVNSGTPTYSGNYTKIGNIVHANMAQSGGNITFGAGSRFSGLPFTTSDKENGWYFCTASGKKGVANNFNGTLYVYSDEGQTPSNISALKISLVYRVT